MIDVLDTQLQAKLPEGANAVDPQTRAALVLIVQDRDQDQLLADNLALSLYRRDAAAERRQAYNLVLATFAGALGYTERVRLELALATGTDLANVPAPEPGPDDPTDEDEPAAQELPRELRTGTRRWASDVSTGAAIRPVMADPMGGWEPRS